MFLYNSKYYFGAHATFNSLQLIFTIIPIFDNLITAKWFMNLIKLSWILFCFSKAEKKISQKKAWRWRGIDFERVWERHDAAWWMVESQICRPGIESFYVTVLQSTI